MTKEDEIYNRLRSLIGKEVTYRELEHFKTVNQSMRYVPICIQGWNERVERGGIEKYCAGTNDYNALYLNEKYAKKGRWKGLVAPPTFLLSCDSGQMASFLSPPSPEVLIGFHAGLEMEFYQPVRPGDTIKCIVKIKDVYFKKGRRMSKILLTETEGRYENQRGEVVGTVRNTYMYVPQSDVETHAYEHRPALPLEATGQAWVLSPSPFHEYTGGGPSTGRR